MTHHTLTLNYSPTAGLQPDTAVLQIQKGDTISFHVVAAPPDSKFKIRADHPDSFSPPEVSDSSTKIKVVEAVKAVFSCQVFDAKGNLLSPKDQAGLHVRP